MGCFFGCFGAAKERRRRRRKRSPSQSPSRPRATPRRAPEEAGPDGEVVSAAAPLLASLLELRDSTEDMCFAVVKKKVTFDPNVTTYEAAAIPEDDEEADGEKDEARKEEEWTSGAKSEAYPLNYRYSNCADSDNDSEYEEDEEDYDDEDEDGFDECAVDDDEDGGLLGICRGEEESCESLFSLPTNRTKEVTGQEVSSTAPEAAAPCPARDRSQHVSSVLNPVGNLTQWKEAKSRTATAAAVATALPKASNKENISSEQENRMSSVSEPAVAAKKKERPVESDHSPSTPSKQEISVDASLSTWLGSSGTPESNSVRSYSPISREDRPILGALTVEDIKISSANSSPRRSPSRSPEDMPILGTVGAYWSSNTNSDRSVTRGGFMRTRSRFAQDKMVNCH